MNNLNDPTSSSQHYDKYNEIEITESNYIIPQLTEEQQVLIDEIKEKLEDVNDYLKKSEE